LSVLHRKDQIKSSRLTTGFDFQGSGGLPSPILLWGAARTQPAAQAGEMHRSIENRLRSATPPAPDNEEIEERYSSFMLRHFILTV
jgi:hypothetical protein